MSASTAASSATDGPTAAPVNSAGSMLPRRQSCDRCHEQKVRCIRCEGSDETLTGETAFPCMRCKRAGAQCIYSYQQRPGRPPLSRSLPTSDGTPNPRKRPRKTASQSIELPPTTTPMQIQTSLPPVTMTPFVFHGPDTSGESTPALDAELDAIFFSNVPPPPPPPTTIGGGIDSVLDIDMDSIDHEAVYDDWLNHTGSADIDFLNGLGALSTTFSLLPSDPSLPDGLISIGPPGTSTSSSLSSASSSSASSSATSTDGSDLTWYTSTTNTNNTTPTPTPTTAHPPKRSSLRPTAHATPSHTSTSATAAATASITAAILSPDPTESYIAQFCELNLRIFRCASALAAPTSPSARSAPLSVFSPHLRDISDATSSLINLLALYTSAVEAEAAAEMTSMDPLALFVGHGHGHGQQMHQHQSLTEPDPGVVFLILACHQRLFSAFENMCLSIHNQLQSLEASTNILFSQAVAQQQQQQQQFGSNSHIQQTQYSQQQLPSYTDHHHHHHGRSASIASTTTGQDQAYKHSSLAQSVMVIQLISHLINRLDRALQPLCHIGLGPHLNPTTMSSSDMTRSGPYGLNLPNSPISNDSSPETVGLADLLGGVDIMAGGSISGSSGGDGRERQITHSNRAAVRAVEAMQRRHTKLRADIRGVKRLIKRSDEI